MKNLILLSTAIGAALLAVGCGPSGKESTPPASADTNAAAKPTETKPAGATSETTSNPTPAAEVKAVVTGATASAQESVKPVAEQAAQAATNPAAVTDSVKAAAGQAAPAAGDAASQFLSLAQSQSDKVLASIGEDLAPKLKSLASSLGDQPALKSQVDSTLKSLVSGDSAATIEAVTTLAQAKLTPEQTDLAKQARDLAAAYVVQKDLASLEGVQGEVATVVSSLRKGEVSTALPALSGIASKAKLTPAQKNLVSAIAEKYAPAGLKQTGDALQQGLKSIPDLGK